MYIRLSKYRSTALHKAISVILSLLMVVSFTVFPINNASAQNVITPLNLPVPGASVPLTGLYNPPIIKGLVLYPENPLKFDFVFDSGDKELAPNEFREEATKLVKYFMASLTIPEEDLWVNLSPYEKDRIVPTEFGLTEMGKDMLAQDYMLKQFTASLMNPNEKLGEMFWEKIHAKAQEKFGTTEIPASTFNKIWIIPESIKVFEHEKGAFVLDSHLKIMLEEDYLAVTKSNAEVVSQSADGQMREETKKLIKEYLLPEIEREVNEGKTFSQLRQIFNSLILAIWYKQNLKSSLLGQVYVNKKKVDGVNVADAQITQKIYEQYLGAFKQGVYDFIKEDYDPVSQQIIPRKYFSGGVAAAAARTQSVSSNPRDLASLQVSGRSLVGTYEISSTQQFSDQESLNTDVAMLSSSPEFWKQQIYHDEMLRIYTRPQGNELESLKMSIAPQEREVFELAAVQKMSALEIRSYYSNQRGRDISVSEAWVRERVTRAIRQFNESGFAGGYLRPRIDRVDEALPLILEDARTAMLDQITPLFLLSEDQLLLVLTSDVFQKMFRLYINEGRKVSLDRAARRIAEGAEVDVALEDAYQLQATRFRSMTDDGIIEQDVLIKVLSLFNVPDAGINKLHEDLMNEALTYLKSEMFLDETKKAFAKLYLQRPVSDMTLGEAWDSFKTFLQESKKNTNKSGRYIAILEELVTKWMGRNRIEGVSSKNIQDIVEALFSYLSGASQVVVEITNDEAATPESMLEASLDRSLSAIDGMTADNQAAARTLFTNYAKTFEVLYGDTAMFSQRTPEQDADDYVRIFNPQDSVASIQSHVRLIRENFKIIYELVEGSYRSNPENETKRVAKNIVDRQWTLEDAMTTYRSLEYSSIDKDPYTNFKDLSEWRHVINNRMTTAKTALSYDEATNVQQTLLKDLVYISVYEFLQTEMLEGRLTEEMSAQLFEKTPKNPEAQVIGKIIEDAAMLSVSRSQIALAIDPLLKRESADDVIKDLVEGGSDASRRLEAKNQILRVVAEVLIGGIDKNAGYVDGTNRFAESNFYVRTAILSELSQRPDGTVSLASLDDVIEQRAADSEKADFREAINLLKERLGGEGIVDRTIDGMQEVKDTLRDEFSNRKLRNLVKAMRAQMDDKSTYLFGAITRSKNASPSGAIEELSNLLNSKRKKKAQALQEQVSEVVLRYLENEGLRFRRAREAFKNLYLLGIVVKDERSQDVAAIAKFIEDLADEAMLADVSAEEGEQSFTVDMPSEGEFELDVNELQKESFITITSPTATSGARLHVTNNGEVVDATFVENEDIDDVTPTLGEAGASLVLVEERGPTASEQRNTVIDVTVVDGVINFKSLPGSSVVAISFDRAMLVEDELGGIDFTPGNFDIQREGQAPDIQLPANWDPDPYMNIKGFTPVMINVTPIQSIPLLLGVAIDNPPFDAAHDKQRKESEDDSKAFTLSRRGPSDELLAKE